MNGVTISIYYELKLTITTDTVYEQHRALIQNNTIQDTGEDYKHSYIPHSQ